jgi:hypothetical protein
LTGDSLDSLYGGSGDDELNGTLATSLMDGGAGRDLFIVNYGSGSGLTLLAGDGDDTVSSVSAGDCRIEGGLAADGNNTILEVQRVGVGDGSTFVGVLVLQNVAAGSLTAAHFVQHVTPTVSANTARPVPGADTTLAVAESDSGVALGLQAPIDPDGGAVTIRMERITLAGGLTLADGSDVHPGDELTLEQFKGLAYVSYGNQGGDAGSFRYSVTDNEGSTVMCEVRIDVTPVPDAPYLYDIYEDSYVANGGTVFSIDLDGYVNVPIPRLKT